MYVKGHTLRCGCRRIGKAEGRSRFNGKTGKNSTDGILSNEKYRGVYIFHTIAKHELKGNKLRSDNSVIEIEVGMPAIIEKSFIIS